MNLLRRFDVVHGANNTLTWDDGEPGGYTRVRTEDGLWMDKSIAATPEEQRQREADALRRELTGSSSGLRISTTSRRGGSLNYRAPRRSNGSERRSRTQDKQS
jgi:hypothetical protein